MKIFALLLNILLLGAFGYLIIESGYPAKMPDSIYATLFFLTPIANIIALMFPMSRGWIGLFLKRKALEEEKKIQSILKNS